MQYACALMPVYSNICIYIRIAMYIYIYIYMCVYVYIYICDLVFVVSRTQLSFRFTGVISLEISNVARALLRRDLLVIRRQLPARSNLLSMRIRARASVCVCVQGDTINPERSPSRSTQINQEVEECIHVITDPNIKHRTAYT